MTTTQTLGYDIDGARILNVVDFHTYWQGNQQVAMMTVNVETLGNTVAKRDIPVYRVYVKRSTIGFYPESNALLTGHDRANHLKIFSKFL